MNYLLGVFSNRSCSLFFFSKNVASIWGCPLLEGGYYLPYLPCYLLDLFVITFSNNSTAFKCSTWNRYFANDFWGYCIAFKFAWYCVNCFDYPFLILVLVVTVAEERAIQASMQEQTAIDKQLGNIQSKKLRLLFTIFFI